MRLANASTSDSGRLIRAGLLRLARQLNSELAEPDRILLMRDPRCIRPFMRASAQEIIDASYIAIGTYIESPEKAAVQSKRIAAYLMLERYFVWCRALWEETHRHGQSKEAEDGDNVDTFINPFDVPAYKTAAFLAHWLAALCPVIEGWEELKLSDPEIDGLLLQGSETDYRARLFRFRHGVVHYQRSHDDSRFTDFMNSDSDANLWAVKLERNFSRFFEHHVETDHADLFDWLSR